jgi:hypothetical protein
MVLDQSIIEEKLGKWGGSNANDNRVFVNACLWIVRTGALMIFAAKSTAKTVQRTRRRYLPVSHVVTCHPNMASLTLYTAVTNAGATGTSGIIFLPNLLMSPTLSGL